MPEASGLARQAADFGRGLAQSLRLAWQRHAAQAQQDLLGVVLGDVFLAGDLGNRHRLAFRMASQTQQTP